MQTLKIFNAVKVEHQDLFIAVVKDISVLQEVLLVNVCFLLVIFNIFEECLHVYFVLNLRRNEFQGLMAA